MTAGRLKHISYEILVERCRTNDHQAQRELYSRLANKMFAVCLRYVGDREQAKDMLQEGFITLFKKLADYRAEGSFEGWARRIFITTSLMYLRKKDIIRESEQIDGEIPLEGVEVFSFSGGNVDADTLMGIIMKMPHGYRTVLNLYIEGYSHKEIGEMLGINEGSSRSQFNRARAWLAQRLKRLEKK